jgi:hypothetical protein
VDEKSLNNLEKFETNLFGFAKELLLVFENSEFKKLKIKIK